MFLVAVSGGLDSVALLWRLLAHGTEPVHAHHVSLRSRLSRTRQPLEDAAMAQIVPWLRSNVRDFTYTESVYEGGGADIVIVTEQIARLIAAHKIPRPRCYARGAQAHDNARQDVGNRQARALERWRHHLGPNAPPIVFPIGEMTRSQYLQGMPPELVQMTWSCRKPMQVADRHVPCWECRTCREMIAEGIEPARTDARVAA